MIEFIKEYPDYSWIVISIFFEVIAYSTWCNQDYEKWINEFKIRYYNFLIYAGLPILVYMAIHYFLPL